MKESNITNIIRQILGKWFPLLMLSLMAALIAGIISMTLYQPTYRTQAMITVYGRHSTSVVYNAQQTSEVFAEILSSNLLPKKVAEAMGIDRLPGTLSCSNVPNTNIITITAAASSPKDVMTTINGVLDHHHVVTEKLLGDIVLQVLEAPPVPTTPVEYYNELKVLAVTFCAALAVQCAILFAIFYFRDDIKNESEVEQKLDTKLFATIYHEDMKKGWGIFRRKNNPAQKSILITNPLTNFGYIETINKMCVRLEYMAKERPFRTLMITSVMENDGKTTVAANLALSLAQMGKKVLLLDLDLKKPAIFKIFELPFAKEDPQVGDVLTGKADIRSALRKPNENELYLLAGKRSYANSDRMLDNANRIIAEMKDEVDYIIIDTPPIAVAADTEDIIRQADAALLVVRQNGCLAQDINDAIDLFRSNDCRLLGCVFNDVKTGIFDNGLFSGSDYQYRYRYRGRYYDKYTANQEKTELK